MLKQRVITALILAPLALGGVFLLEPVYFSWFVALILSLAAWEWANLSGWTTQFQRVSYSVLMAAFIHLVLGNLSISLVLISSVVWWLLATCLVLSYPASAKLWSSIWVRLVLGVFIIAPMWKALVFIRTAEFVPAPEVNTLWLIFYMLMLVWVADTGAYFAGRAFGNKKLAPKVSPGKSWAGAWGGLAATGILSLIASYLMSLSVAMLLKFLLVTLFVGAISIIGDLTESMFKRQRGIKDSSNLLPGHGGVLDRIDSLVAAIPVFVFALHSLGWIV